MPTQLIDPIFYREFIINDSHYFVLKGDVRDIEDGKMKYPSVAYRRIKVQRHVNIIDTVPIKSDKKTLEEIAHRILSKTELTRKL